MKSDFTEMGSCIFVIKERDGKHYAFGHQIIADSEKYQIVYIIPTRYEMKDDEKKEIFNQWEKFINERNEVLTNNNIPILIQFVDKKRHPVEYQILSFSKMIRNTTLFRYFSYRAYTFSPLMNIPEHEYWEGL